MHTTTLTCVLLGAAVLNGCATGASSPAAAAMVKDVRELVASDQAALDLSAQQRAVETFLTLPPEVRDYLDREIRPIPHEEDRYRALRRWAFEDFQPRYSYDPGYTAPLDKLDAGGRINCFSFSNMFVAAARYVNVPAEFQLVDSPPQWNMSSNTFVVSQHINVTGMLKRNLTDSEEAALQGQVWQTGTRIHRIDWDKLHRGYVVDLNPAIAVDSYRTRTISDQQALALYYSNRSVEALLSGDSDAALAYGRTAIVMDDQSVTAWSNLGVILSRAGNTDAALQAYLAALSLDRDAETATVNLERVYRRTGEVEKADTLAAQTAARRKRNPYYHYSMGEAMLEQGDLERALEHFKDAISRKEDERLFYYGLAKAQIRLGEYDKATRNLEQAREHSSTNDLWRFEQLQAELNSASRNG